ncbi:MAG: AMP-binding protein [Porticoccus sp.]
MPSIISQLKLLYRDDQTVARDTKKSLSCTELLSQCEVLTNTLKENAIQCLALHADNGLNWLTVDLTCQHAEISLLPLPTFFSSTQLKYALQETPVDAIIADSSALPCALDDIDDIDDIDILQYRWVLDDLLFIVLNKPNAPLQLPPNTGKITYTSGSTGTPKGVCLSNDQLLNQAYALAEAVAIPQPRHLCLLPLSTLLENVAGIYAPLLLSGEVIVPSLEEIGFTGSSSIIAEKMIQLISEFQPNSLILTPQLLLLLVAAAESGWIAPTTLRFVAVGGSRVAPDLLTKAWAVGIPAYEGYGLSECASVVSLNTPNNSLMGSCGKPLPHLDISITDGEVIVSGNTMLGYINEPDSWGQKNIHTGDLGSLDDEGFLHINGRRKNLLVSSFGRNISPEWVESEFLSCPIFSDFVVFGDAQPFCIALLSPRSPQITDDQIQRVVDKVNQSLPDYARVNKWYRLPQPLSSNKQLMTDNGRPIRSEVFNHYAVQIQRLYKTEPTKQDTSNNTYDTQSIRRPNDFL